MTNHRNFSRFMTTTKLSSRQVRWAQELSRYNFVIDYRFGSKNSANGLSRRLDHMTITKDEIEDNRQILTRLRQSLQTNSNEFSIYVNEVRVTMLELNESEIFACELLEESEENSSSGDFLLALDTSDVIINEWKTLVLNSATILESIDEMIARKHIHEHDAAYDDNITGNLVELIRSLLKEDFCAIQMKQKLVTSEKSHSP